MYSGFFVSWCFVPSRRIAVVAVIGAVTAGRVSVHHERRSQTVQVAGEFRIIDRIFEKHLKTKSY